MSGDLGKVSLGSNWLWLLSVRVLSLVAFAIIMRLNHKAWKVSSVLGVISSWTWDSIVVLLLSLVISSTKNRFS
jgi:hypothetical protein